MHRSLDDRRKTATAVAPAPDLPLRERKKRRTRQAIVDEALALFARRGYAQTTVADIAAACELSPSTVFTYFPTKDAIVFEKHAEQYESFTRAIASRPDGQSAVQALRGWLLDGLNSGFGIEKGTANLVRRVIDSDQELLAQERYRLKRFEDVLRPALANDLREPADSFKAALLTGAAMGAMTALIHHLDHRRTQSRPDVARIVNTYIAMIDVATQAMADSKARRT